MFRNRNGYWMSDKFSALFAPDDGGGEGGAQAGSDSPADDGQNGGAGGEGGDDGAKDLNAQLEQMKADMARMKSALDKATHEASENKKAYNESQKALKAKMTQEEIDAQNKKEAEDKTAKELEELRREVARAKSTKSVMSKLGIEEDEAGKIAECLSGCEDIENALLLIRKSWDAREKALKLEYGKIPGPGAGGSNNEDAEETAAIERAKALGRDRASADKSVTDALKGYMR